MWRSTQIFHQFVFILFFWLSKEKLYLMYFLIFENEVIKNHFFESLWAIIWGKITNTWNKLQDYNPAGAVGNAAAATADKGHAVIAAAGRALAQLLSEVHQLPLSTLVNPDWNRAKTYRGTSITSRMPTKV